MRREMIQLPSADRSASECQRKEEMEKGLLHANGQAVTFLGQREALAIETAFDRAAGFAIFSALEARFLHSILGIGSWRRFSTARPPDLSE
jgi:hypothetical protein